MSKSTIRLWETSAARCSQEGTLSILVRQEHMNLSWREMTVLLSNT